MTLGLRARPEPDPAVLAALAAAAEALCAPAPPPPVADDEPPYLTWRFSGRLWARPAVARRDRPLRRARGSLRPRPPGGPRPA